jgi:hypothetical protein
MKGYKIQNRSQKNSHSCVPLSRLQSRLQRIIMGKPMPASTLSSSQGLRIWPLDLESGRISGWVADTFWHAH